MIGYNDWIVEHPWNIHDCIKCSAWNGTGCTLTACCRTSTYIYINGTSRKGPFDNGGYYTFTK